MTASPRPAPVISAAAVQMMALGVALAAQVGLASASLLGPDPLVGTPYSTEHDSECAACHPFPLTPLA